MTTTQDRIEALLTEAETGARSLLEAEELDEADEETIADLAAVADQAQDLLSTVDVSELLAAIDVEDVPEAVDLQDLPAAIEEREPGKAVTLRRLLELADLSKVLASTDLRQFRREKAEFEEAVDDVTGDAEAGGSDDGGLLDGDDVGLLEGDDDGLLSGDGERALSDDGLLDGERGRLSEAALQSKLDDAVSEFRERLVETHRRLEDLRESNRRRMGSQDDQPSSRNPTAYSSLPPSRRNLGRDTRHSTVPAQVRHSNAPGRRRIYGSRFEEEEVSDDG